ncbi:MAG: CHAP domain-containing protein [Sandaracinaceae bacterium]|nr:CHAP domain-containing protein [Sandaracinaceae bacterium]
MRRLLAFSALLVLAASLPAAADDTSGAVLTVTPTWPAEWPMDPAPITTDHWPELPPPLAPLPPATPAAARVVALLERVQAEQRDLAYQHRTSVNERLGRYRWDCSGMVSWVIRHAAPRAGRAMGSERLAARGLYRMIERAPTDRDARGWQRIDHIEDVRAGDVFAWRTAPGSPSRHTGHTGFVVQRPRPVPGLRDAYAVRVADSIVGPHQDDSRAPDTDGGLGTGVFVFLTDGEGHATHYGWHGTRTAGYMRTPILFGRLR